MCVGKYARQPSQAGTRAVKKEFFFISQIMDEFFNYQIAITAIVRVGKIGFLLTKMA